ncbi:MAG: molybdopterin-dependent oxidoreductase, partial [Microcella sp.]|uniref:molybdopterin-dependent oxidoreductase n=1 Tax=Microcella sp. TaxID=1913979 RepID=UPI0033160155
AVLLAPASSPVLAVGSLVIDLTPPWLKEATIAVFGTDNKAFLLVMVILLVAVLAIVSGMLERRRAPWGAALLGAVGAIAVVAVVTRAEAEALWSVPTIGGAAVGILVLRRLSGRLDEWLGRHSGVRSAAGAADADGEPDGSSPGLARRSFFGALFGTAAAAAIAGVAARVANSATAAVTAVREALTLPAPARPAAPIPAGARLDVAGITPLVTANRDFYRIDTALQVPRMDAAQWRLRVTGLVEQEIELDWAELSSLPLQESYVTLMCVSNEVGGDLTGNALWLGHPIREVLARARPLPEADMVLSVSQDGWTAGTPLDVLQDDRDALLAIGMNGEPLPLEHGFPVRMVVPGLYGYVSATKWVVELRVTRFDREQGYWTPRGWSALGPVKTHSRIDVPRERARVSAGPVPVAGIAWAQQTGIDRVEVRVDGGEWNEARLAEAISIDTWRQWVWMWEATSGTHVIEVRATDAAGFTQREQYVPVAPNGAEGYHAVTVQVDG